MPGIKPQEKVDKTWSPNLAYAIGLITTDGCLYNDGRHIEFTSDDEEQLKNFSECLGIHNKIGQKRSGFTKRFCGRIQFGDISFYRFLLDMGLTPAKSKSLGSLHIPRKYFFDFLRGVFDGDGTFFSYYDSRWKSSFMFYLHFISASLKHLQWIRGYLFKELEVKGCLISGRTDHVHCLKYAKRESLKILRKMYYTDNVICLNRKRLKIEKALSIVGASLN